jgi:acyl dehydratase
MKVLGLLGWMPGIQANELSRPVIEQQLQTYLGPLDSFEFAVSKRTQGEYLEALEDYHLRYVVGQRGAPPIVHPGILLSHSNATRSPSFGGPNTHWIHMREETHFANVARLDDRLVVRWRVEEHEPWFGRLLARVSCSMTRHDGLLILRRLMWGFRTSVQRPIPAEIARASSDPVGSAPSPDAHSRTTLNPADWTIPGRQKRLTAERMKLFSGRTSQNLHTDDQVARDAGLPAPIASAAQGMGYLCEFLIDNLGEEWLTEGSWKLDFRKPMFPGDQINALGTVKLVERFIRGDQWTVDVRLANHHGTTVTQGTATTVCTRT